MPNGLPKVGVQFTAQDIERFVGDVKRYNAAVGSMKAPTQGAVEAFKNMQAAAKAAGGSLTDVSTKTKLLAKLRIPGKDLARDYQPFVDVLRVAGWETEVLHDKTQKAGTETQKNVRDMNKLLLRSVGRGGTLIRFARAWGGTFATVAAVTYLAMRAVRAFQRAITGMFDELADVGRMTGVRVAFERLSSTTGMSLQKFRTEIARATKYTVDSTEMMIQANKLLMASYKDLAKAMPELAEVAHSLGRAIGVDTAAALDDLIGKIKEGDAAALEAEYGFRGLTYAVDEAARKMGINTDELTDNEKAHIILQAVLPQTEEMIKRLGSAAGTSAGYLQTLWQQLAETAKMALAVGLARPLFEAGLTPEVMSGMQERVRLMSETLVLYSDFKIANEEGKISAEAFAKAQEAYDKAMALGGQSVENLTAAIRELQEAMYGPPVFPTMPEEHRLMMEEYQRALPRRLAEMEAEREDLKKFIEGTEEDAKRWAMRLAEYLPVEEALTMYEKYMTAAHEAAEELGYSLLDVRGELEFQERMRPFETYLDNLREANRETRRGTSALREYNKYLLLMSTTVGPWARAFAIEHGMRTPLEQYKRHEQPLVAAMVDKMWGEQFKATMQREPTEAEWQQHWYEYWYPKEAFPGGPIGMPTGPLAEQARALLAEEGFAGLGDVFHETWLASKTLTPSFEELMTESKALALFQKEIGIPKQEDFTAEIGNATAAVKKFREVIEPPVEEEEEPTKVILPLMKPITVIEKPFTGVPEGYQFGGITRSPGWAFLHGNEAVLPLSNPVRAAEIFANVLRRGSVSMPVSMGGGLSIGQINVPVTIAGGATPDVAVQIQSAVVAAIRTRTGAQLRRAAQRMGF